MGHHVSTEEMHQPYVRTGVENILGHRTSSMFCYTAKEDGKVVSVDEHGILVEYKDGSRIGVNLGRSYGKAEGSVYPHDIVTIMKAGQAFVKGDTIAYNTGFFEPDHMNPQRIVYKYFTTAKTALMETTQTHEDSSAISKELGQQMRAKTTKVRSFTIDFVQNLRNVVKPGDKVDPKTFLMLIEDEITSSADIFDERSLTVLQKHASQAPRANYLGVVDKIEVYYHGDKKDMSSTLKSLADRSDRLIADQCKATGKPVITGQVNDDYRVGGVPLTLDKAEVRVYITIVTLSGVGDKGIFANQMKSVIGEVMDYSVHAQDGTKVDAIFGFRSIAARIVESPIIIGTTTTLLKKFAEKVVQIYRK